MRKSIVGHLSFIALAALAAPKTPAKGPASACSTAASRGSCVQKNGDSCIDYTGTKWTAATIKSECSSGWIYSATPCTTPTTVGTCAYSSPMFKGMESVQRHYAKSGMSTAQAEAYCKGN